MTLGSNQHLKLKLDTWWETRWTGKIAEMKGKKCVDKWKGLPTVLKHIPFWSMESLEEFCVGKSPRLQALPSVKTWSFCFVSCGNWWVSLGKKKDGHFKNALQTQRENMLGNMPFTYTKKKSNQIFMNIGSMISKERSCPNWVILPLCKDFKNEKGSWTFVMITQPNLV